MTAPQRLACEPALDCLKQVLGDVHRPRRCFWEGDGIHDPDENNFQQLPCQRWFYHLFHAQIGELASKHLWIARTESNEKKELPLRVDTLHREKPRRFFGCCLSLMARFCGVYVLVESGPTLSLKYSFALQTSNQSRTFITTIPPTPSLSTVLFRGQAVQLASRYL